MMGKEICDRCGEKVVGTIMSMFCQEIICMDCKDKEKQHLKYEQAVDAEDEQIRQGHFKFQGIGKPADL